MKDGETANAPPVPTGRIPSTGTFIVLLIVLWVLNFADIFQTLYLKESGFLAKEANLFINFFLEKGHVEFLLAKILALVLITSILIRGWADRKGCVIGGYCWKPHILKRAIILLLNAGVIYYILIVAFPFFAMTLSGLFEPTV